MKVVAPPPVASLNVPSVSMKQSTAHVCPISSSA